MDMRSTRGPGVFRNSFVGMKCRSYRPSGLHEGARSTATGMYFGYMRIARTAQRSNSPCKWIYKCAQKKGPVLRLALKGSLNREVSKGPEETTNRNLLR